MSITVGPLPNAANPDELLALANVVEESLEYVAPDKVLAAVTAGLEMGGDILRDTEPGSRDRTTTTAALGIFGATQAPALWGVGERKKAWTTYKSAANLLIEGEEPCRVLWVRTQQISSLVINGTPSLALVACERARVFAEDNNLTSHPNFARFLVTGEVRALIAVRKFGKAHDSLSEAVELMTTAPGDVHIGLHQTGMSVPEFSVSVATRYNEFADGDSQGTYRKHDRDQAHSYASTAMPDLDQAGATGLRSFARIEIARTMAEQDPQGAGDLLTEVLEISRARPMEQVVGKWDIAATAVTHQNPVRGKQLLRARQEWRQQDRTRRFWEKA
jgi:hypothetical protein